MKKIMEDKYPLLTEEDKKKYLELDEVNTYFLIDECGAFTWRMNHEMAHGRISEKDHTEIQYDINMVRQLQQFLVDNLMRFGVDPESAKDRENGDYWKWYHHWDNWKKSMSEEDWVRITQLIQEQKSFDEYLPNYSWNGNYDPVI